MKTFKRILASILLISTIIGFGFLAGATISRLYDRITGGVIDADHDDAEFDAIINELNGHTAAVAPHTGQVKTVGDTMTGNLIMDGADVRIYDGNDLKLYSDGGTTLKASIDGATGEISTAAQTRYFSVSPTDYAPQQYIGIVNNSYLVISGSYAEQLVYAPIHLPQGSTITEVKLYYASTETHGTSAYSWGLTADAVNSTSASDIVPNTALTNNTSGVVTTSTVVPTSNNVVDNVNYAYTIRVTIDNYDNTNDMKIYKAVVKYTVTTPLP